MDKLSLSHTRLDVLAETPRISQEVANECGDKYSMVHYNPVVAKPAMQIQLFITASSALAFVI